VKPALKKAAPPPPQQPDGAPTPANPTFSLATPGPAQIGVPNFFIDHFRIPPFLLPIYQAAGTEYGIRWELLAAINEIETDYGRNLSVSTAGAVGWMQFLPGTWKRYGVDANNDGLKDPYNPMDAIFGAARYLRAAGADKDIRAALFSYNHADWYVRMILDGAEGFQGLCDQPTATPTELGDLPADPLERIIRVASWIDQGHHPYCWGGGHATTPGPSTSDQYCRTSAGTKAFSTTEIGLDCSGAVRWLLVLTGYKDPGGISSGSFNDVYPSGQGRYVTIWSNAAHVFIEVHGKGFWGTTQPTTATGLAGSTAIQPQDSWLATRRDFRHRA
jgi:Transglycosylase SLT domain